MRETATYRTVRAVVLAALVLFVAGPIFVIVSTSVKPLDAVRGGFRWWPDAATLQPYLDIWSTVPLLDYFRNSLVVTSVSTVLSVLIAIFAGYAMARLRFRGRTVFGLVVLSTQMFPGILFLLPLFLIFTQIQRSIGVQLNGSYLGLIITYLTFTLPFATWMLNGTSRRSRRSSRRRR